MAVDGKYAITLNTPMGKQSGNLTLKADGASLSGNFSNALLGQADFDGGKVTGDSFEFSVSVNSPMGKLNIGFNGTVSGDKLSAKATTPMGPLDVEGTRA